MTNFDNSIEKVSADFEQLKGKINQRRGKGVKGGLQRIRGKVRELIADVKSDLDTGVDDELW